MTLKENIVEYTIQNKDLSLTILNYGATITKLIYKGVDVALGYEDHQDYFDNGASLGMTVMPNANRIGKAEIDIKGVKYHLQKNDGNNNLHSHKENACQKKMYLVRSYGDKLVCETTLKDDEDNFPGNRKFKVVYQLKDNALHITYSCLSDKDTIFNPTQHTYFNLNGHDKGTILDHYLKINANNYTVTDKELISTGEIVSVVDTPMDFREYKKIGQDIRKDYPALNYGKGYDNNWCINDYDGSMKYCASLKNEKIEMEVYTTQPGIQVYTGNYLAGENGKGNYSYLENYGVALETQFYPDCNHHDNFVSSILNANEIKSYETVYQFKGE